MTKPADLSAYLFEGRPQRQGEAALASELRQWMEASIRFTTFVETYRDKIRKKVRVIHEPESLQDLRAELEVARGLLSDRRLEVIYEPYASAKRRGADFAVTYRANRVFNIEVARMRIEENGAEGASLPRKAERILLNKLGQMQPGMANLLVIHLRPEAAQAIDLDGLMQALKARVEGKDPLFYAAGRFASPADFYKDFNHLSGVLLWAPLAASPAHPPLWVNKQARPGLEDAVLRVVAGLVEQ